MATKAAAVKRHSTQSFLDIAEIKEDVVVMKDGTLRAVLLCSSVNFALKSEEEQEAIISAYVGFLNALDYPLQIVVQSRRLNIQPYLDTLAEREKAETNELLKVQITEYIEFVKTFVELTKIVTKTFYVVVPFQPSVAQQTGGVLKGFSRFFGGAKPNHAMAAEEEFTEWKNQLTQRVDAVTLGLRRLDLRVVMLNTEELVELFYGLYNPTEAQRMHQEIKNAESATL